MRINELLSETQHTDEGVGQFLGKAAGAVGGAVGNVQGAVQGMQNVYGQKRDRVAKVAQRNVQRAGGYKQPAQGTTPTATPSPSVSTPTAAPASTGGSGTPYVAPAAPASPGAPTPSSPTAGTPATSATPAMRSDEIVDGLKSIWDNATSDHGSETGSVAVQQQIRAMARTAGLAGHTMESFHSKFLDRAL